MVPVIHLAQGLNKYYPLRNHLIPKSAAAGLQDHSSCGLVLSLIQVTHIKLQLHECGHDRSICRQLKLIAVCNSSSLIFEGYAVYSLLSYWDTTVEYVLDYLQIDIEHIQYFSGQLMINSSSDYHRRDDRG